MNTRLIWNFEICNPKSLAINSLEDVKEECRWEARFFWDADKIINLEALSGEELQFINVETKHQEDCYILLPNKNINLKIRRDELLYKPLMNEQESIFAYGSKMSLKELEPELILPETKDTVASLLQEIEQKGKEIKIAKDILTYKFNSKPKIKLEFSRLKLANEVFLSFCIQGRSFNLVAKLAKELLAKPIASNYVSFLKKKNNL